MFKNKKLQEELSMAHQYQDELLNEIKRLREKRVNLDYKIESLTYVCKFWQDQFNDLKKAIKDGDNICPTCSKLLRLQGDNSE